MTKRILSTIKKILIATSLVSLINEISLAQSKTPYDYVNPFIGTAKSDVITKWGNNGGTYPGAVAPSGFVQLTPDNKQMGHWKK